ncbi:MAG TPA: hypothetical protein VGU63_08610 [Candidatus Acidoferrales bacterium]|nr:hypothetical protein [Candidatus Acidoferrales bacterium]
MNAASPGSVIVRTLFFSLCLVLVGGANVFCQTSPSSDERNIEATELAHPGQPDNQSIQDGFAFRPIGPAGQGGRVSALAVVASDPDTFYCGAATGGVWKTTDGGITFRPVFQKEPVLAIGEIAIAASNPSVVWVGTGGPVSNWGNGVYKSTDAGATWTHMGLDDTQSITGIIIDSKNPAVVYVGALGHSSGPNEERGLFKTTDGGKTWSKILFINDDTGVWDMASDPAHSNVLYVSVFEGRRPQSGLTTSGPGFTGGGGKSALYKSVDSGATWKKLTRGLPYEKGGDTAHISVAVYRKNPNIIYARVEHTDGGIFRSEDSGETWVKMGNPNRSFGRIIVDPNDDQRIWVLSTRLFFSANGGKTFDQDLGGTSWGGIVQNVHFDFRSMWIDPSDSRLMIAGNDGGVWITHDRGHHWEFVDTLPVGQFYELGYDNATPYHICGGMQDNGDWCGASRNRSRWGITREDWFRLLLGDGVYTTPDPTDSNIVYAEAQSGSLYRRNLSTHESASLQPQPAAGEPAFRWPFDAPFVVSSQDHKTLYVGANFVFKSTNRGDSWTKISGDLTVGKGSRSVAGFRRSDILTAISESPINASLLWVGSGDGALHVTRDGGKTWTSVVENVPVPKGSWVGRIEASHFAQGTAYVTFDRSNKNDYHVYAFRTMDFGQSWTPIKEGIAEPNIIHVIREDPYSPELLFAGTEFGGYVSFDQGASWKHLRYGLPNVSIHDIQIQPREHDLIVASYGLSFWVLDDIRPLEELKSEASPGLHLFNLRPSTAWRIVDETNGFLGNQVYIGPNPAEALIDYCLMDEPKTSQHVKITILDEKGNVVRELEGPANQGINRVGWDLRYPTIVEPTELQKWSTYEGFFYNAVLGPRVEPGTYTVKISLGVRQDTTKLSVVDDPKIHISALDRSKHDRLMMDAYDLYQKSIQEQKNFEAFEASWMPTLESRKRPGAPPLAEEARKSVDLFAKQMEELHGLLANPDIKSFDGGRIPPNVPVQLTFLLYTLESSTAAPTEIQTSKFAELKLSLARVSGRLEKLENRDAPEVNNILKRANAMTIR